MATFQNLVIIIAFVILILSLSLIGMALRRQKYHSDYPPVIANCPDYWIDGSGNNGSGCKNNGMSIGNSTCSSSMDFSKPQWAGERGMCAKYKWATQCNLSWDGITNKANICGT